MLKKISVIFTIISTTLFSLKLPLYAATIADADANYLDDIDQFMSAGADAYLAWQFSGQASNPFENDPFSFFEGGQTCQVLKEAAAKYPGKIGVNIFNYQYRYQAGIFDGRSVAEANLNYLKSECGTSIVRFFGTQDPDSVIAATRKLQQNGLKAVIALHNFAIGGQLSYFEPNHYNSTLQNAKAIASRLQQEGLTGSIYTLELSNEPHCGNSDECLPNYITWITNMVSAIRSTGFSGDISIGQASQVARNSRGDSVKVGSSGHPIDFEYSNSVAGITKTSGHHYDPDSVEENLAALALSKKLGKIFYIGEAAAGDVARRRAATKVIPSQNTIGGVGKSNILQCSPITEADKTSSPYWPVYFKQTQQEEKCYFPTFDWGYGSPIADPCSKDGKPTLIDPTNRVKIINPTETLMWLVNSINEQTHDVNVEGKQLYTYDGAAPDYAFYHDINGSGNIINKMDQDTPREVGKSFTDFRSGSLPRAIPYSQITDEAIDKWLCQMAATNTAESCINNQQYAVYDLPLGFLGDVTDKDFGTYLPNSGTIDRTVVRQGKTDILIKASDLYCARKPGCGNLATNCSKAVGLDPNSEIFKTFWGKLRLAITDNRTNIPDKAIITRCQELPNVTDFMHCSRLASASGGYPDLIDVDLLESPHADKIVNDYYGKFHQLKKGTTCRSCITSILLLPGVTQARNANEKLGCGYGTPLFSHQANMEFEKVIDMGDQKPPVAKSNSLVPVGMNNYQEIIDVVTFNPLLNLITSILRGTIGVLACQIDWVSEAIKKDDQGNDIFKNIAQNACSATVPVKVFTTLWMNSDTQIAFQCSQNLNSFLQPHSLTRISGSKPNPYYILESKFQAPDSNSALGPRDMSLNDISDSGGQGVPKEGQAMPVYLDKSDEEGTLKRAAGLVPYSQQGKFKL